MASLNCSQLRADARENLAGYGKNAVMMVLLQSGVTVGISLVITAINYILDLGIAQTGGLGGMDTRATLETIQTILTAVQTIALPFWQMGYIFAVLQMARRQAVQNQDLLMGFRRFGPVLRGIILRGAVYCVVMMVGAQVGSLLFMLTPAAREMLTFSQELTGADTADIYALMENEAYMEAMLPAVPFMLGGMLLPMIPVYYRLRLMDYVLMDEPCSALYALIRSIQLTRKQFWTLLKLDLQFWWFYLLQLLTVVLCYGDVLLPIVGVELGISAEGAMYLFYGLALLAELALYVWKRNQVFTTYALLYDQLCVTAQTQPEPKPQPKSVPWQY